MKEIKNLAAAKKYKMEVLKKKKQRSYNLKKHNKTAKNKPQLKKEDELTKEQKTKKKIILND